MRLTVMNQTLGKNDARSARMKDRIMRAALACIYEKGLQNTSTVDIAKRAEVSRGAMLHHYPSKRDLLIAAYSELLGREVEQLRSLAQEYSTGKVALDDFIDYLWSRFSHDPFAITVDFIVAARTDDDLKEHLARTRDAYDSALRDIWRQFFIGTDEQDDVGMTEFSLTISLFRGLALQSLMQDDTDTGATSDMIAAWKQRLAFVDRGSG